MNGRIARKLRETVGGQEILEKRQYGFVKVDGIDKRRIYNAGPKLELTRGHRNYKVSPLKLISPGRLKYLSLKKEFKIEARSA